MRITWHGHSNFELNESMDSIIDPFFMGNKMTDVKWNEVKPDVIAVTHGHADHLGDTLSIAKRNRL